MASSRVLRNVVTVYKPKGEDEQGKMQWEKFFFEKVYYEASRATAENARGRRPSDSTVIYIFSERSVCIHDRTVYAAGDICKQMFAVENNRDDFETDMMYISLHKSESDKPPNGSLLVKKIKYFEAGSSRMWHWEVEAR